MRYVIIGNSAAGIGAVQGIRELDKESEITIISDEKYHTYSRPLISYMLKGDVSQENIKYRPEGFYKENNVKKILGKKAVSVDKNRKAVVLEDGNAVQYDKLLIATGSKPFIPEFKGLEKVRNKFTFMKLDDVKAIERSVTENSRVLVVGAGLIGLKAAEALLHYTKNITVIDLSERILPSILDDDASGIMQKHIEDEGVKFILGASAEEFSDNSAVLTNGDTVDFDILILAVGVRPNTELIEHAGGKVDKGIVTDEKQAVVNLVDIYAAGDCTRSRDITSDSEKIIAILPNAFMQGYVAGKNMAGSNAVYENAFPMNAIGFMGLHIISAGNYSGEVYSEIEGENYKKLFTDNNRLKGFILMGEKTANAGIYTSLIRERIPLDTIDFELLKENPSMMAFSAKYRKEKLGGVV